MEISGISTLQVGAGLPIRARVLSKGSIFRTPSTSKVGDNFELILIDGTGSIHAQVVGPQLAELDELIRADRTYVFKNFRVIYAVTTHHSTRNALIIRISRLSEVEECKDVAVRPLDTIVQLNMHRPMSPYERFYRETRLNLINLISQTSTYLGCPDDRCRRSIGGGPDGPYVCVRGCRKTWERRVTRYCIRLRFQDRTGFLDAVGYDEVGFALTGMTAVEFRNWSDNVPRTLGRRIINRLLHRMYDIRVQVKLEFINAQFDERISFIITNIKAV